MYILVDLSDKWIGWDKEKRLENLQYIVNMSRFLIRNNVKCKNLASHVLALVMKQLPSDFEKIYALRPLLVESFVDTNHFKGTCYKAAAGRMYRLGEDNIICIEGKK